LNFTSILLRRFDGEWGRKIESADGQNQWLGMVQSLAEGDADLAVASITMNPER